MIKHEEVHLF